MGDPMSTCPHGVLVYHHEQRESECTRCQAEAQDQRIAELEAEVESLKQVLTDEEEENRTLSASIGKLIRERDEARDLLLALGDTLDSGCSISFEQRDQIDTVLGGQGGSDG